jgi:hypothetical protein
MAHPIALSEQLLRAVRQGDPTDALERQLATIDADELAATLDGDDARVAFWINVYNAAVQHALADDPGRYESRREFFKTPLVTIADERLSPDRIEHGILRRSYHKYTLGYVRSPLRDSFVTEQELGERDPRIHFVLNCGANSCPPIAAYTRDGIDQQLDWATEGYLEQVVEYDADAGRVSVPRVMLWFRGDFGGKDGIYEFLRGYDRIPPDARPGLSYREWDWTLRLGKYAETGVAAGD